MNKHNFNRDTEIFLMECIYQNAVENLQWTEIRHQWFYLR